MFPEISGYKCASILGQGGYGSVYFARKENGAECALKVLSAGDREGQIRIKRERNGVELFRKAAAGNDHLIQIHNVGDLPDGSGFYYEMELADRDDSAVCGDEVLELLGKGSTPAAGGERPIHEPVGASDGVGVQGAGGKECASEYHAKTLRSRLRVEGALPVRECVQIGLQLLEALGHLHLQGLVHRDVKPSNVLVVGGRSKLADPGLVVDFDHTNSKHGTQVYMPELGFGEPSGDLYSLGRTLYELATCQSPQRVGDMPSDLAGRLDRAEFLELMEVVFKACQIAPSKRYSSAVQMKDELAAILNGVSLRRNRILSEQFRRLQWAVVALVAVGALGWGVAIWARRQMQRVERINHLRAVERIVSEVPVAGWTTNVAWYMSEAAQIQSDDESRRVGALTLAGMEAKLVRQFTNVGAGDFAYDSTEKLMLIAGKDEQSLRMWNEAAKSLMELPISDLGTVRFDERNRPIHFGHMSKADFAVREAMTGEILNKVTLPAEIVQAAPEWATTLMSPNGRYIGFATARGKGPGRLCFWDTTDGKILSLREGEFMTAEFTPDSSRLLSCDDSGNCVVWTMPNLENVATFQVPAFRVAAIKFVRNPESLNETDRWLVACGGSGGQLILWNPLTRQTVTRFQGSFEDVLCIEASSDGVTLVSGGHRQIRFWDIATGEPLLVIGETEKIRLGYAGSLILNYSGKRLTAGTRKDLALWWTNPGQEGSPKSVDARMGVPPENVYQWDIENGRGVASLRGLAAHVSKVVFSPDGKRVVAIAQDRRIGIWSLDSGRLDRIVRGPQFSDNSESLAVDVSVDGRLLAVAGDQEISMWDLEDGRIIGAWKLPWGRAQSLKFNSDGTYWLFRAESPRNPEWSESWVLRKAGMGGIVASDQVASLAVTNATVLTSLLLADLNRLVVVGAETFLSNSIAAVSVLELPELARRSHKTIEGSQLDLIPNLAADPTGRRLCLHWPARASSAILKMDTEADLSHEPFVIEGMDSAGFHFARSLGRKGCELIPRVTTRPSTFLGTKSQSSTPPVFSADGGKVAWGGVDGRVYVADLSRVYARVPPMSGM